MLNTSPRFIDTLNQRTGFRAWSSLKHGAVAGVLLLVIALAAWKLLGLQREHLELQHIELAGLQQQVASMQALSAKPVSMAPDFTQRWPQRDEINALVRFLGGLAQERQVNVGQMSLAHTGSGAQAVGRVDIALTLSGPYIATKQLLAELLSRYPSLAVQSLSAVPRSGDVSRIEWTLSLTLFVKD